MNFRLFQNIRQKHTFLTVFMVCFLILILNCFSFIFSDVDDAPFLYSLISLNFEHFINSYQVRISTNLVLSAFFVVIPGRSPPLG